MIAFLFAVMASSGCASASPDPATASNTPPPSIPPPPPEGDQPLPSYRLDLRGALEFGEPASVAAWATRIAVCTFTVRAGARIELAVGPTEAGVTVGLFGPVPASGELGAAPRWSGALEQTREGPYGQARITVRATLPEAGTYLAGVHANDVVIPVTLGCASGECRPECGAGGACPSASSCASAACDEAPCPSYCVPVNAGDVPSPDLNAGTLLSP